MPLFETESLVIKSYNLGEADKIVVLLTHDHGVVRGVAKGAKRLKSKFGSGLEPFSLVHVSFFEKESQELVSIQKVDLIRSNFAAASNPDFLQKFAYLGELLVMLSPPHDPSETLYRMVSKCVEAASSDQAYIMAVGVYFELWMVRLSGYLPDWSHCDNCGRPFEVDEHVSIRSNFHLGCIDCFRSSSHNILKAADRNIVAAAMSMPPVEFAETSAGKTGELGKISSIMKRLISQSVGKEVFGETSLYLSGN